MPKQGRQDKPEPSPAARQGRGGRPGGRGGVRERLSDMLELPRDLALDLPRVSMVGAVQVTVENHRGLVEYTPERVCINTSAGQIVISGKEMVIGSVYEGEIIVTGNIRKVAMEPEDAGEEPGPPQEPPA